MGDPSGVLPKKHDNVKPVFHLGNRNQAGGPYLAMTSLNDDLCISLLRSYLGRMYLQPVMYLRPVRQLIP